jgi:hypothetical protein
MGMLKNLFRVKRIENGRRCRPSLQELERRDVPASLLVTGTPEGMGPVVTVKDIDSGSIVHQFFAFDDSFRGGVHVARGDVNGDGVADIVATPGAGGGPIVRIFDGVTAQLLQEYEVFEDSYRGGVALAVADVDGDLVADIIVAPRVGSSRVRVISGLTVHELANFFAYEPSFFGGVYLAAADLDGDGRAEIITGPGNTGGPLVKVFDQNGQQILGFFAFERRWRGGVRVAAVDIDGDGIAEIVTGAGQGGGPVLRVFDAAGDKLADAFVFDKASRNGLSVAAGPMLGQAIPTIVAFSGGQSVLLDARTLQPLADSFDLASLPGFQAWSQGQPITNQLSFAQPWQAIPFRFNPVGLIPGNVALVGNTTAGSVVRLYDAAGTLLGSAVANGNGDYSLVVAGLQHGQSYIFEERNHPQDDTRPPVTRRFTYNEWLVEDQRTRERLLAAIPQLRDPTLNDFARVNLIREWAYRNFILAHVELQRDDLLGRHVSHLLHEVVDRHATGFFCSGMAQMLASIYRAFGYNTMTYNHGVIGQETHVTTLVNINHQGQRLWVVQDAYLDFSVVAPDGSPLDVRDFLAALVRNDGTAFRILEGPADAVAKLLMPAVPGRDPSPTLFGTASTYLLSFRNPDGSSVYLGYRNLQRLNDISPDLLDELQRRGRLPNLVAFMIYPLDFGYSPKLSEVNSQTRLVSDLLRIAQRVSW